MRVDDQKALTDEQILRMAKRGVRVGWRHPEPYLKQKCDNLVNRGLLRRSHEKYAPRSRCTYWLPAPPAAMKDGGE